MAQLIDASGVVVFEGEIVDSGAPTIYSLGKTIIDFTETAGAGTYTATFTIAAGAMIGDVRSYCLDGPWDADEALLTAGDGGQAHGYVNGVSLVTELAVPFDPTAFPTGPYANDSWAASQFHSGSYNRNNAFGTDNTDAGVPYPDGETFTATVVATGAGGTTGRLRVEVFGYGLPAETINAVKS